MYNKCFLIGNLTQDVELRYTPTGTPVASFRMATNRRYGDGKEENFYTDVAVFGKMANVCNENLKKGSRVFVEGRLVTESWESNGQKKSKTKVILERMRFLDAKKAELKEREVDSGQPLVDVEPF